MFVDRIMFPITALGPGNRLAIWVSGCDAHCEGCANPELWRQFPEQEISVERLVSIVLDYTKGKTIDGITITGGEPFNQAEEIVEFLKVLNISADVLVFSGFCLDEIKEDKKKSKLLNSIDVLVDGRYVESLNDGKSCLRGSTNQTIYFLNPNVKSKYDEYIKEGRKIQNFVYDYKIISVGIHKNDQ